MSANVAVQAESAVDRIRRAASTDPIAVQRLRGNLSLITGAGGNVVLLDDAEGVLLVDSAIDGRRVEATAGSLTTAPIRYVVNTHWHFDHTDGNEWLALRGATIIAQENTRRHLSRATRVDDYGETFPPRPAAALPRTVFADRHLLAIGGATVTLVHYDPGHTDSDISVRFPNEDVLQVGDTWWNGIYPFIDYSTGGSIDGLIAAARWNLMAVSGDTLVVPGHGPAGDRAGLAVYYDMLVAVRETVAGLKGRGFTLDEVIAGRPTAAFDDTWGNGLVGPEFFTRLVYRGV
jgi:glyoxylase-like metal-dependent hydrolase (beta-lactamase superfamily II)